jgi:hypothetical protein
MIQWKNQIAFVKDNMVGRVLMTNNTTKTPYWGLSLNYGRTHIIESGFTSEEEAKTKFEEIFREF